MAQQRNLMVETAFKRFLDRIRSVVRAYPIRPDAEMPDHDIVVVDEIDCTAGQALLSALRESPEVWAKALPDGLRIVRKADLEKLGGIDPLKASVICDRGWSAVLEAAHLEKEKNT